MRVNRYLVGVMQQRKEDVLPQVFVQQQGAVQRMPHVPADLQTGTTRPIYLTAPSVAMQLLLCTPPFHPLMSGVGSNFLTTDSECSLGESNTDNSSPHRVDFAGFMNWTNISDGYSLWSLYMGPVYAHANEYTADKGNEVDMTEVSLRKDEWGQPFIQRQRGQEQGEAEVRGARQLFIDDVEQLPVTRRMPFGSTEDIHLYAPTLAACFRAQGVMRKVEGIRLKWKAHAERLLRAAAAHDDEDGDEDKDEEDAGLRWRQDRVRGRSDGGPVSAHARCHVATNILDG